MTGPTPQGQGEQTQPMAIPPWPEVAGGWPGGRAERGPYADADTIDELDAVVASQTGAEAGQGSPGAGPGVAVAALAGVDWPDAARRPGGPLLAWLWGEQGQARQDL